MVKLLEQKLDRVVESINQYFSLLFKNEREIGSMVYTNSVRIAVIRRVLREQVSFDDLAFDALVDQEIAKREAEQKEIEATQLANARKAALEKAAEEVKGGGASEEQVDATVADIETREFGGDFGRISDDETVGNEESNHAVPDGNGDRGGAEEPEGVVEDPGTKAGGVRAVDCGEEEG